MPIGHELFKDIMATFPTGVAIVTATGADGDPRGLTVSAFCPVSLHPPLVLVCIDKTSNSLPAIEASGGFTVNFIAGGREDLVHLYASKAEKKFDGVNWRPAELPEAGPILTDDTVAHVVCRVHSSVEAGDHWIFVGEAVDGGVRHDEVPLVYGRRAFTAWDVLEP